MGTGMGKQIDKDMTKHIRTLDMERGVEMGVDTDWDMDTRKRINTKIPTKAKKKNTHTQTNQAHKIDC